MQLLLIILLAAIVLLFGLASISQSYAASQQAQAAIEASRAAQIASAGNLITIATLVFLLLAAVSIIVYLLTHKSRRQITLGSKPLWEAIPEPDANTLLPALLTMMMYQIMQQQHQQEIEQFWMNEPHQDVPSIPDITWDM